MKTDTLTASTAQPDELTRAPHVLAQLVDLLDGSLQATPALETQIAAHLANCPVCQNFIELALLAMIKDEREREQATDAAQALLARWSHLRHATYTEEITAYVDTWKAQGEQAAQTRFPLLTEHLPTCPECQAEVRDLRVWLDMLE